MAFRGTYLGIPALAAGASLLVAVILCVRLVRRRSCSWAIAEAVVALCETGLLVPLGNSAAVASGEVRPLVLFVAEWHPVAQGLFCLMALCTPVAVFLMARGRRPVAYPLGPGQVLAAVLAAIIGMQVAAYLVVGVSYRQVRPWYEPSASVLRVSYLLTWFQVTVAAVWIVRRAQRRRVPVAVLVGSVAAGCVAGTLGHGIALLDLWDFIAWTDAVPAASSCPPSQS
ncbi:hypothetical protein AAK967_06605 [Atopobiaceae bacterium 24-176]